ncbi:MAG: hypothetical protein M1548_04840 [Actinobacteria bacterium]|nr:hypothetical protein [Actinomycetota bacterium]
MKLKDLLKHVIDVRSKFNSAVKIAVVGGDPFGEFFRKGAEAGSVDLIDRRDLFAADLSEVDLVVQVLRPGESLGSEDKVALEKAPDVLVVVDMRQSVDLGQPVERALWALPRDLMDKAHVIVSDDDLNALLRKIAARFEDRKISLASALPVFRPLVAGEIIVNTSLQNGGIATISVIPGADMPVLTANQLKMVLELMAVYGEEPTLSRLKEVLAVVGGGFIFRTVARELLDFLPGPGWIVKGGMAIGGTIVVGKAAQAYFEQGKGDSLESLGPGGEVAPEGGEAGPLH